LQAACSIGTFSPPSYTHPKTIACPAPTEASDTLNHLGKRQNTTIASWRLLSLSFSIASSVFGLPPATWSIRHAVVISCHLPHRLVLHHERSPVAATTYLSSPARKSSIVSTSI
jgi:hypothetical protein